MIGDGKIALDKFMSRYYKELRYGSLKDALNEYCNYIEEKVAEFAIDNPTFLIQSIIEAKDIILEAEKDFLSGLIGDCYDKVYNVLFIDHNIEDLGLLWKIDKEVVLFRMRSIENQYLLSAKELNHIPFNKRDNISNQRFSLSGFPCLYLGTSIYVCWEELMRPNINTANVASFLTREPLNLICFDYWGIENISDEQLIYRTFFKIATSMTRKDNTSRKFKREYIIPQAILHSMIKWNSNNDQTFEGIAYLSSHYDREELLYNSAHRLLNIVIPTKPHREIEYSNASDSYCEHIHELFEQQGPISLNIFNILRPEYSYIPDEDSSEYDPYTDSELYRLESYLRDKYKYSKYFWERPSRCKRVSPLFCGTME